jgi:hypothetical protein
MAALQEGLRDDAAIAADALALHAAWKAGRLGGEVMPEDAHPPLDRASDQLAAYFTLGMSLNYQRNSYALWRACTALFEAEPWAFDPAAVADAAPARVAAVLLDHRVALQPNRHPEIWARNAAGLVRHACGSVRALFEQAGWDLAAVRAVLQAHKTDFPYLCGPKIANYWLYVMASYMDWPLVGRSALSVAPDRHVIAAAVEIGLVAAADASPEHVAARWAEVAQGTGLAPIDLHTPLWLWSRAGFPAPGRLSRKLPLASARIDAR